MVKILQRVPWHASSYWRYYMKMKERLARPTVITL